MFLKRVLRLTILICGIFPAFYAIIIDGKGDFVSLTTGSDFLVLLNSEKVYRTFYCYVTALESSDSSSSQVTVNFDRTVSMSTSLAIPIGETKFADLDSLVEGDIMVHIYTSSPVSLSVTWEVNYKDAAVELRGMMQVLPTKYLGTHYVVVVPPALTCDYTVSIGAIATVVTEVDVDLKLSGEIPECEVNGVIHNEDKQIPLVIQPDTVRRIKAIGGTDITGTSVFSDYKVAIILEATQLSCSVPYLFLEQYIPVFAIGNEYRLHSFSSVADVNTTYRVVAVGNETTVHMNNEANTTTPFFVDEYFLSDSKDFMEFSLSEDFQTETISADKPVLVMAQIMPNNGGDGSMTLVTPLDGRGATTSPLTFLHTEDTSSHSIVSMVTEDSCYQNMTHNDLTVEQISYSSYYDTDVARISLVIKENIHLYVPADLDNCKGVAGFVISTGNNNSTFASYILSWGISCPVDEYFDTNLLQCTEIVLTTEATTEMTTEPDTTFMTTEKLEEATTDEIVVTTSADDETTTNIPDDTTTVDTMGGTTTVDTMGGTTTDNTVANAGDETTTEMPLNIGTSEDTTSEDSDSATATTTTTTTTTEAPKHEEPSTYRQCPCKCKTTNSTKVETYKEIIARAEAEAKQIRKELTVPVETLSQTVRAKISATDSRPAAVSTGMLGVVLLLITFCLIISADLISVVQFFLRRGSTE